MSSEFLCAGMALEEEMPLALRDLLVHGLSLLLDHKCSELQVMWHGLMPSESEVPGARGHVGCS